MDLVMWGNKYIYLSSTAYLFTLKEFKILDIVQCLNRLATMNLHNFAKLVAADNIMHLKTSKFSWFYGTYACRWQAFSMNEAEVGGGPKWN